MPDRILYGKFEVFEDAEAKTFTVELEDQDDAADAEVTTFSGPHAEERAFAYRTFLLAGGLGSLSLLCQICRRSWRPRTIDDEPLESHCPRCEKRYGHVLCEAHARLGSYSLRLTTGDVLLFNEAYAKGDWIEIPHAKSKDGPEFDNLCIRVNQISWVHLDDWALVGDGKEEPDSDAVT